MGTVRADDRANRSPYEIHFWLDAGISAGSFVATGVPRLLADEFVEPWCGLDCDPGRVNDLDRRVIGNHSELAATLSDTGVGVLIGLPFALDALDVLVSNPRDGWLGFGKDSVILVETLALTTSLVNILKLAVRRPRPLAYDENRSDDERTAAWAAFSFPSGHTATSFAMATAYSYTFTRRHPDSPLVIPVWAGTYLLAGATGVLRTEAGDHFWTDVISGGLLGIGMGLLIPWLHEPADSSDAAFRMTPIVGPDSAGFALSF